jgi:hypothetical protein
MLGFIPLNKFSNGGLNMNTVVIFISLAVFIWIGFVVSFQGLDLRKRSDWLYGVSGFLCGLALGIAISGNFIGSLNIGAIFAFMTLFSGVTMRRHKQKYGGIAAKSLVRKYGKEDDPSVFAKLVRKLLLIFEKSKSINLASQF